MQDDGDVGMGPAGERDRIMTDVEGILGGPGRDGLYGGSGNDVLTGSARDDGMYGQAGNDTLQDLDGADQIHGMGGNDTLDARDGVANDFLNGADGTNTCKFDQAPGETAANCTPIFQ